MKDLTGGLGADCSTCAPPPLPDALDGGPLARAGRVFDTVLPLDEVAEAYAAMDERRAVKVMLRP